MARKPKSRVKPIPFSQMTPAQRRAYINKNRAKNRRLLGTFQRTMTPGAAAATKGSRKKTVKTKGLTSLTQGARDTKMSRSRQKIAAQGGLQGTFNRKKTTVKTNYIGSGPKIFMPKSATTGRVKAVNNTKSYVMGSNAPVSGYKKFKSMVKFKTKQYGVVKGVGKLGTQMGRKWGSAAQKAAIAKLAEFNRRRR
jgi:hypothetical protein